MMWPLCLSVILCRQMWSWLWHQGLNTVVLAYFFTWMCGWFFCITKFLLTVFSQLFYLADDLLEVDIFLRFCRQPSSGLSNRYLIKRASALLVRYTFLNYIYDLYMTSTFALMVKMDFCQRMTFSFEVGFPLLVCEWVLIFKTYWLQSAYKYVGDGGYCCSFTILLLYH